MGTIIASLIAVGESNIPKNSMKSEKAYIQLLQLDDFCDTAMLQCKIEIRRTIYYYDMHSHVSIVSSGTNEFIHSVEICVDLHTHGPFCFRNEHIRHTIKGNCTVIHSITLSGFLTNDGSCRGSEYSDLFGTWNNVIVQDTIRII